MKKVIKLSKEKIKNELKKFYLNCKKYDKKITEKYIFEKNLEDLSDDELKEYYKDFILTKEEYYDFSNNVKQMDNKLIIPSDFEKIYKKVKL